VSSSPAEKRPPYGLANAGVGTFPQEAYRRPNSFGLNEPIDCERPLVRRPSRSRCGHPDSAGGHTSGTDPTNPDRDAGNEQTSQNSRPDGEHERTRDRAHGIPPDEDGQRQESNSREDSGE